MPVLRRPLRERRNVQLNVATSPSKENDNRSTSIQTKHSYIKAKAPVRGGRRLRLSNGQGKFTPDTRSSPAQDLQSMHEFLPFLFIAFSNGQYTPASLKASYGIDFTHIVKIAYPSLLSDDCPGSISTSVNKKTGVQTLTLTIAAPQRHARTGVSQRMFTLLTEEQLLAARDFLSLALPYYLEARPSTMKVSGENVAVLITAPGGGGAADIISAITCYLSFASETPVETVLAYIDEEECLGDEWKDAISCDEDGVGFVQKVVDM
ncbi:hypothetical protein F5887DRAFT_891670 [Amanita rubescens]|nr:hypothetical protein F5887DRAFT_891670 [Amanita rubescens]